MTCAALYARYSDDKQSEVRTKVEASPRNHLKLRYQIAHISRPSRAAFLRPQVLMVAPSRNH